MGDLLMVLRRIIGQKLNGVTEDPDGWIQLHFDDWVVMVKEVYPAPIIERVT